MRANVNGGRWNPPGIEALYASLDKATATAEIDHLIASQPFPIKKPRVTYTLQVSLSRVVILESSDLASVGLSVTELGSADMNACQRVGGAVAWLGYGGLLAPSARCAQQNLVMYVNTTDVDDVIEVTEDEPYDPNATASSGP
jgi:RES domain-containing protein